MKKRITLMLIFLTTISSISAQQDVSVTLNGREAELSNGIVTLSIGSNGRADMLKYKGMNMLSSGGIYFDYTAKGIGNKALSPSKAEIVKQTADYAEVLYTNTSDDLRFQHGYIVRKGVSGVYMYVIVNGTPTSSSVQLQEARVCTRTNSSFLNGYVDDSMRGKIPSVSEMSAVEANGTDNAAYVQDATYKMPDGTIYTKYNWGQYVVRDSLHGLMHNNGYYGLWNIPCSQEWMPGGPMKQELTVHATGKSPISIQMLQGEHFGTASMFYNNGESKIYGPFFLYLNFTTTKDQEVLIADAKREAHEQMQQWPFQWFENKLYPLDRSTVTGKINVTTGQACDSIQVVLAQPDTELFDQGKNYMFWALTDKDGNFTIKNVRKGTYALRAYATKGDVTDELQLKDIKVDAETTELGTIDWTPARYENMLFQIGQNNRMSDGFNLSGHLRAYGLWEQLPANLTYKVGTSTEEENWYYAQGKNGTWTIQFDCPETYSGDAHLTISAAGVTNSPKLAIGVNGSNVANWAPSPNDAGIYRSAVLGGRHRLYTISFPASKLRKGTNSLTLKMSGIGKNGGIMYDCIKLETGNAVVNSIDIPTISDASQSIEIFTLNGLRIGKFANQSLVNISLAPGMYIFKQGSKTGKFVK